MVFCQNLPQKFFGSTLLPITLKITPNIISRLLLPIEKLLENLKFEPNPKGLAHGFLPKSAKKFFRSTLLPITLKITQNIISLLFLPLDKVLENLKF